MPLLVLLFGKKLTLDSLSKQNNLWENYEHKWRQRWVEKFEKYWNQDKFTELRNMTLRRYQPPNLQFLLLLLEDSWIVCVWARVRVPWVTQSCLIILRLPILKPTMLFCPWHFPGKNTGMSCYFLFQGIFLTQGLNPCLLLGRQIIYRWATREAQ